MWASGSLPPVLRQNHPIRCAGSNAPPKMRHLPVNSFLSISHPLTRLTPDPFTTHRTRINRLTSGSGSWLAGSNSSYSMGSGKSWGVCVQHASSNTLPSLTLIVPPPFQVSGSVSNYSMDQSQSLYSMSSGSASLMSGIRKTK